MKAGKKTLSTLAVLSTLSLAAFFTAPTVACAYEVEIAIAPGVLIIDADTACTLDCDYSESLTVHAEILYKNVCNTTDPDAPPCLVQLCYNTCLDSTSVFADSRGDLVAKFSIRDVLDILPENYNAAYDLTLQGDTLAGDRFSGTDELYLKEYNTEPTKTPMGPMGPGTHSKKSE
ncbi:MAG: hypothetical protein V1706_06355 [Pseudomonadota bacterium]